MPVKFKMELSFFSTFSEHYSLTVRWLCRDIYSWEDLYYLSYINRPLNAPDQQAAQMSAFLQVHTRW